MRRSAFGFVVSILSSHFPSFVRRGQGRSRLPIARIFILNLSTDADNYRLALRSSCLSWTNVYSTLACTRKTRVAFAKQEE